MSAITLHYATRRSTQVLDNDSEIETGTLRVGLAATELVLDDGARVLRFDFDRQRTTELDRERRAMRDYALIATVHERFSGMASAIHSMEVLQAGGAIPDAAVWQAEACYGLEWHDDEESGGGDAPRRGDAADEGTKGLSWSVGDDELIRVQPVEDPPKLPEQGLKRLLRIAFGIHPKVATELVELGVVPQTLDSDDHFPLCHQVRHFKLVDVEPSRLDCDAMAKDATVEPLAAEALAQAQLDSTQPDSTQRDGTSTDTFRLDAARAALTSGNRLEAILAVFTHNWAHHTNTDELVQEIFDGVGWLDPVKKIPKLLTPAKTARASARQIASLEKLRSKAGAYAYALDVVIGEKHVEHGESTEAQEAFSRALIHDPGLAATWISLGRTYIAELRFADGWSCFERGSALCPTHSTVREVHRLEADLHTQHRALF